MLWNLIKAFAVGGLLCTIGEVLVLKTKLTPARILVGYIVTGVILSALGLYAPLAEFAGAGATVPLTGFGHALTNGVKTSTAAGIAAAVFFGAMAALVFKPHAK